MILFWMLNWTLAGLRTHWGFFPLWLGYILAVDSIVFMRKGNSLITRSASVFILLFVISAPSWWLFEILNGISYNWEYIGREKFSFAEYTLLETLSFTTVMPAVFSTAELASTFGWIKKIKNGPEISDNPKSLVILFVSGWIMLFLFILYPGYFFVFMWISVYFILEPVNVRLRNKSLLEFTSKRNWQPVLSLWTGCLICGFFWEMWNYYSYPKWIYNVPFVDYLRVFEMPVAGYLGYLPFALELFALFSFISGIFKSSTNNLHEIVFPHFS